jgi:hypothetical protein
MGKSGILSAAVGGARASRRRKEIALSSLKEENWKDLIEKTRF